MTTKGITLVHGDLEPTEQILEVKTRILGDVRTALRQGQQAGFPTDTDDYTMFLKQRGRTRVVRNPASLTPASFTIGTRARPTEFEFVTEGNFDLVKDAATDALIEIRRRAPVRTGHYLASMQMVVNGRAVSLAGIQQLDIDEDTRIRITNFSVYASVIEAGFYRGYYDTQQLRGGIFYYVAKMISSKFGRQVAIRFFYLKEGRLGTVPVIEIGPAGSFADNFAVPGRGQRNKGRRPRR